MTSSCSLFTVNIFWQQSDIGHIAYRRVRYVFFPLKFSSYIIFCYFCNGHASPKRRVGQKLIGTETTKPFVGQVSKRRLRTLSFCAFKSRKFETFHRR